MNGHGIYTKTARKECLALSSKERPLKSTCWAMRIPVSSCGQGRTYLAFGFSDLKSTAIDAIRCCSHYSAHPRLRMNNAAMAVTWPSFDTTLLEGGASSLKTISNSKRDFLPSPRTAGSRASRASTRTSYCPDDHTAGGGAPGDNLRTRPSRRRMSGSRSAASSPGPRAVRPGPRAPGKRSNANTAPAGVALHQRSATVSQME